jgi:two-component system, NtrC family, sensor kinase
VQIKKQPIISAFGLEYKTPLQKLRTGFRKPAVFLIQTIHKIKDDKKNRFIYNEPNHRQCTDNFRPDWPEYAFGGDRMRGMNALEEHIRLIERNKELTCLYEIAKIVADSEKTVQEVLQTIVSVLPPAFHYPDMACARIRLDDVTVMTAGFEESEFSIREALMIDGRIRGMIEVYYRTDNDASHLFLHEEQKLLKTIARQSALMIEIKLSHEAKNRLENQLRHADRLAKIGQLTSGIAHELNEPLLGILGFAQLAVKKLGDPETAKRYLDRIVQSSLHAREIIRKMMQFSSPSLPRMEEIDLNRLIEQGMAFITPRFQESGVRFEWRPSILDPVIDGDASQITQILVNLIINAIHAMPEGGTVTVTTSAADDVVQMGVQDTGTGMDQKTVEQIFLPFFTTKDVDMGTGLGLSVVHGIVSAHGGTVEVSSRVGQGSVFKINFPAGGSGENRFEPDEKK